MAHRDVSGGPPAQPEAVLCISPYPEDHAYLQSALPTARNFYRACSYREALGVLRRFTISAVICECKLPDGTWKDLLSLLAPVPDPPPLIVMSRLADEQLWAEVLELGGYDVLAKPFEVAEVVRVVGLACGQAKWNREHEYAASPSPIEGRNLTNRFITAIGR